MVPGLCKQGILARCVVTGCHAGSIHSAMACPQSWMHCRHRDSCRSWSLLHCQCDRQKFNCRARNLIDGSKFRGRRPLFSEISERSSTS
jgi:hypothetical protein